MYIYNIYIYSRYIIVSVRHALQTSWEEPTQEEALSKFSEQLGELEWRGRNGEGDTNSV